MAEPVAVAWAKDEAEALMIQGLLEGAGIPSAQQRTGVNGPMLGIGLLSPGGGSRRVLVSARQAEDARDLLAGEISTEPVHGAERADEGGGSDPGRAPRSFAVLGTYARGYAVAIVFFGLAFAAFVLLRAI